MARLTASGLSRADLCIGSAVLPGYDESSRWAGVGQAVDDFVRIAKTEGKPVAVKQAPADLRQYLEALTIERIPDGAEYQQAFALSATTGEVKRIKGRTEGYPEDLGPEWILGTADICWKSGDRSFAWDLKWGQHTSGRDPADDLQIGFYGCCVAAVTGSEDVEIGFARAGWDAVLRPDTVVLDQFDLAAMRARIVRIWQRAQATDPPQLRLGDHCGYCKARRNCDAMVAPAALVLRLDVDGLASVPIMAPSLSERLHSLTLEQRGRIYEIAGEVEDRAKEIRAAIRADARLEPVPLSAGRELREVSWGVRQASPEAKAKEDALEEELRSAGLVATVKVPQIRSMAAKRPPKG